MTSNVLTPEMAKQHGVAIPSSGGWISAMINAIRSHYPELVFAVTTSHPTIKTGHYDSDGIRHFIIRNKSRLTMEMPCARFVSSIASVIDDFAPDLVHVNGSEFFYGMAVKKANPSIPTVLSVQGLASLCEDAQQRALPIQTRLGYSTLRDFLANFAKRNRSKLERETIALFSNVIGRTDWDRGNIRAMNPAASYYCVNELLRSEFAGVKWDFKNVNSHTVFSNSGGTIGKGTHTLIEAIAYLKSDYPDVQARIPGIEFQTRNHSRLSSTAKGYLNFLHDLVKKLDVSDHVNGLHHLTAQEMANELTNAHVFALSSHIENSSNSLSEAMLVGTPCVASYCGGTGSMLKDHAEGLMYPTGDAALLAEHIRTLFEDKELCQTFSNNARRRAIQRHNSKSVADNTMRVYQAVVHGALQK